MPDGELDAAVDALARKIVAKSPLALAIGKEAFYKQAELGIDDAYRYASDVMTRNMLARDAERGIDAFIAKTADAEMGRTLTTDGDEARDEDGDRSRRRSITTTTPTATCATSCGG